jgi:hypothetical protein
MPGSGSWVMAARAPAMEVIRHHDQGVSAKGAGPFLQRTLSNPDPIVRFDDISTQQFWFGTPLGNILPFSIGHHLQALRQGLVGQPHRGQCAGGGAAKIGDDEDIELNVALVETVGLAALVRYDHVPEALELRSELLENGLPGA